MIIKQLFSARLARVCYGRRNILLPLLLIACGTSRLQAQDITSQVTSNQDITLSGSGTITLPGGTTTYTASGGISGAGTLEISGTGTLVLDQTNTFALPSVGETLTQQGVFGTAGLYHYEGYTTTGFVGYIYTIHNPDPPAVTIDAGTTLQLGTTSTIGTVQNMNGQVNLDNILDNGVLEAEDGNFLQLGIISGSGSVIAEGNSSPRLYGVNTFTGTLINDTTLYLGSDHVAGSIPNAKAVFSNGSFIIDTPITTSTTVSQNIYENHYGGDINVDGNGGLIVLSGQYSYTDSPSDNPAPLHGYDHYSFNPSLTNVADNYTFINGNASGRGLNIEGAVLQLGDGTTTNYLLPGDPDNTYINLHGGALLAFDYSPSGPTYMNNIISGGGITFKGSFSNPGSGVVLVHQGHLVVTQQQFYDGTTQIDSGGILQLGDGTYGDKTTTTAGIYETSGGDGNIMQSGQAVSISTDNTQEGTGAATGASGDKLINNGSLVIDNTGATEFLNVSGAGQLIQAGSGTTTLYANTTYTGKTTVTGGTLAIGAGGSIATSSGVDLETTQSSLVSGPQDTNSVVVTRPAATFDISQAGSQTITDLSGASGTTVALGGNVLTVGTANSTVYAGTIADGGIGGGTGGGLTKVGAGKLTLSGNNTYTGKTTATSGTLQVDGSIANSATQVTGGKLQGTGTLGSLEIGNGAVLMAGDSMASLDTTLTTSDLLFDTGATLQFKLNTATAQSDTITVDGNLTLNNTTLALTDLAASSTKLSLGTVITLFSYTGTETGLLDYNNTALADQSTFQLGANTYEILYDYGDPEVVLMTVASVPEPSTWAALLASLVALGLLKRRRVGSTSV